MFDIAINRRQRMSEIKEGEVRYFRWGNEPCGKVSTWTIKEDRSVKLLGYMDIKEAYEKKLKEECLYP
jgi:hypothetical protein